MTENRLPEVTDRDVYITRTFAAPVSVVWKFWTDPELLAQWFGPHGISVDSASVIVEPHAGGRWELDMRDDDGVYPVRASLLEVVENEYLEGVLSAETAQGELEHVYLRVQFHDHGETTRVTLHQGPFTPDFRDMTKAGWLESFDKLDTIIDKEQA